MLFHHICSFLFTSYYLCLFVYFIIFFFVFCFIFLFFFFFFFFFQAEDGIRDLYVTGVQTCALPISGDERDDGRGEQQQREGILKLGEEFEPRGDRRRMGQFVFAKSLQTRSEERRVGKECRSRWSADH